MTNSAFKQSLAHSETSEVAGLNGYLMESGQYGNQEESFPTNRFEEVWKVTKLASNSSLPPGRLSPPQASTPDDPLRYNILVDKTSANEVIERSMAAQFIIPRLVLTQDEVRRCRSSVTEIDVAYVARSEAQKLYPDLNEQNRRIIIGGSPRVFVMRDRTLIADTCSHIKAVLEKEDDLGLTLINLENIMMDAIFSREFAELFRPNSSRQEDSKRSARGIILFYPDEGTLPLLHQSLRRVGGAAVAVIRTGQGCRRAIYLGKVDSFWEPILDRLHQLTEPSYSTTVGKTFRQTDKDISTRLSILHRNQLVLREWEKGPATRGAYRYSTLTSFLPDGFVPLCPIFARSEEHLESGASFI